MGKIPQELKDRMSELGWTMGPAYALIKMGEFIGQPVCIGAMGLLVGGILFVFIRRINKENSKSV